MYYKAVLYISLRKQPSGEKMRKEWEQTTHKKATNGHEHMQRCQSQQQRDTFLLMSREKSWKDHLSGAGERVRKEWLSNATAQVKAALSEGPLAESAHTGDVKWPLNQRFHF